MYENEKNKFSTYHDDIKSSDASASSRPRKTSESPRPRKTSENPRPRRASENPRPRKASEKPRLRRAPQSSNGRQDSESPSSRQASQAQKPRRGNAGNYNRGSGSRKYNVKFKKVRKIKPTSRSANPVSDADVQHMPDSYQSSDRYSYLEKASVFPLSKKNKLKIIAAVLILLIIGLGFWSLSMKTNEPLSNYDVLLSDDHSCKIKVPYTWQNAEMANENGLLAAKSKESHSYLYVSMDSNYDKDVDAETYISSYIANMRKNSDSISDFELTKQPAEKKLGPNTGYYFELSASTDGILLHTYDFLILTDDGYLHADITTDGDDVDIERQAAAIFESLRYDRTGQLTDGKY